MVPNFLLKEEKNVKDLFGMNLKRGIVDILMLLLILKEKDDILEFIKHHFFLV